jgi:hypothetical protein
LCTKFQFSTCLRLPRENLHLWEVEAPNLEHLGHEPTKTDFFCTLHPNLYWCTKFQLSSLSRTWLELGTKFQFSISFLFTVAISYLWKSLLSNLMFPGHLSQKFDFSELYNPIGTHIACFSFPFLSAWLQQIYATLNFFSQIWGSQRMYLQMWIFPELPILIGTCRPNFRFVRLSIRPQQMYILEKFIIQILCSKCIFLWSWIFFPTLRPNRYSCTKFQVSRSLR